MENLNIEDQVEEENICIDGMTKSNDKSQNRVWLSYFFLIACISCWMTPHIFPELQNSKWCGPVMAVGFSFGIGFSYTYKNDKLVKRLLRLFGVKIDFSNLNRNQFRPRNQDPSQHINQDLNQIRIQIHNLNQDLN